VYEYYDSGEIMKSYELKENKLQGEYKEFYENGNVKLVHLYKNGMLIDSSIYYTEMAKIDKILYYITTDTSYLKKFENGKLSFEGKFFKNNKVDQWRFFDSDGRLEKVFEYIDLCGTIYTNQGWYFDNRGDTLKDKSNFIKFLNFREKIKEKEILNFKILYSALLNNDSNSFICLSPKIQENFCNINDVELDTIYPKNNSFDISVRFSKKGKNNLRGFVTEFQIEKYSNKGSVQFAERKVYFDLPIIVE
jgi:hypothetical protein